MERATTATAWAGRRLGAPRPAGASLARKPKAPAQVSMRRDRREATTGWRRPPRDDLDMSARDRRRPQPASAWPRARSSGRGTIRRPPLPCPRARSRSACKPDARDSRAAGTRPGGVHGNSDIGRSTSDHAPGKRNAPAGASSPDNSRHGRRRDRRRNRRDRRARTASA